MFVLLKGATKEQAFKIGNEIAEAVTATNPKPIKLKFEKVREVLYQSMLYFYLSVRALLSHIVVYYIFQFCLFAFLCV